MGPTGKAVKIISVRRATGKVVLAAEGGGVFPMAIADFQKIFRRSTASERRALGETP